MEADPRSGYPFLLAAFEAQAARPRWAGVLALAGRRRRRLTSQTTSW